MSEVEDENARELFGAARAMPEPAWNPDPDAFAKTGRRLGRMRVLATGAGATLGVAAVIGGFAFVNGGAGGSGTGQGDAPFQVTPVTVDPAAWEKQVDVDMNMPAVFNALFPDGPTLRWTSEPVPNRAPDTVHGTFLLAGPDGTDPVDFGPFNPVTAECPKSPASQTPPPEGESPKGTCVPTKVPGGTVYAYSLIQRVPEATPSATGYFSYTYIPDDKTQRPFTMNLSADKIDHAQLTPQQFAGMIGKPGFGKLTSLLDPNVKPSAGATARRTTTDAAIAKAVGTALPQGFTLRVTTTNLSTTLELVSPSGVVSGAGWSLNGSYWSQAKHCSEKPKGGMPTDYTMCEAKSVPGGKLFAARSDMAVKGDPAQHWTTYDFVPDTGAPEVMLDLSDAASTPVLTADQFLAIAKTPGIAQTLTDIHTLVLQ